MRLENKVAVIAGAGGTMGTAVPMLFAQEGAKIVLSARRAEPLQAIADRITAVGGEATVITGDLTTAAGAQHLIQETQNRYGRIDILYDNLGDSAAQGMKLHETPEETWEYLMGINMRGAYVCSKEVIPVMQQQGGGVIVLVSANRTVRLQAHPGYAAMKAGLIGLTQSLAKAYRADNIRVVCICPPGGVNTPVEGERIELPPQGLVRRPHGADFAYAALYLASDEAAWITGIALPVDGGDEFLPPTR